jgi:nicotinate-nucleotide adenylyltransferase
MFKETIGILGGSYNPVHIGHVMLASYLCQWKYVDKVWLTLTPRNPLKDPHNLLPDLKRLAMLNIATKGVQGIETCDIELSMPRPNYTINTLDTLAKRYPLKRFKLVIGSDNWLIFEKWRDWQRILDQYGVIVYPRPGYDVINKNVDGMELVEAPTANISSTFIRSAIEAGRDMSCFVPNGVYKFIVDNKLYQKTSKK